jgi:hypothetical protein
MATGTVLLEVQAAKTAGDFITTGATKEGSAGVWKVLFDASSTESMTSQFDLPENYSSSPVVLHKYAMASATTNKVDLETEVMAIADGEDVDTASFDSVNEVAGGTTVPGTAGHRDTIEYSLANDDSMAAEETIILRFNRDHDDADDTASGDLEWITNVFEYTTT